MRHRGWILATIFLVMGDLFAAEPRSAPWKEVDDAVKKGLPKTAIEKLQPIIDTAIREKKYAEAIKAIGKKLSLEGSLRADQPEEKIARMQIELEKSPAEIKPILQLIQANWYFKYFLDHRFKIMSRTRTVAPPSATHMSTWDLPQLLAEIDLQFQKALASAESLKQIPIADYDDLLEKGTCPDRYRPTLYDFLIYSALEFYAHDHNVTGLQKDPFSISVESPIFSDVAEFLAWKPTSTDDLSLVVIAIRLYQDLIRFHQHDADPSALLEADLARLEFGRANVVGDERSLRYRAALKRFAEKFADHEISARAVYAVAGMFHHDGNWVEAREIAKAGGDRFPDSIGGRECHSLVDHIEQREARLTTERVWNKPLPTIDLTYRNVTKIYFRIVPFDFQAFTHAETWETQNSEKEILTKLVAVKPELAWSVELPETKDYKQRIELIPAPVAVKPGSYYLIASFNEQFVEDDNQLLFTEFWVSDLALVIRSRRGEPVLEGFVLNAETGEPIANANVSAWYRQARDPSTAVEPTTTDKNGMFRIDLGEKIDHVDRQILVHAAFGEQSLSNNGLHSLSRDERRMTSSEQIVFFTDRGIYRPGQTIRFKGICFATDQDQDNYRAIPNRNVQVVIKDIYGTEFDRLDLKTNDFGSVSGSLTAPQGRPAFYMWIEAKGGPPGQFHFNVEEYKRPKFRVTVDAPQQAPRLQESVKLTGRATAYSGAAIDGANVNWRVVRHVRYPVGRLRRIFWSGSGPHHSEEIAHGTTKTAINGSFEIEFLAQPDLAAAEKTEPVFQFAVTVDVTDTVGETRSGAKNVSVGYSTLSATISTEEWQTADTPVEIGMKTTSLDGEGQAAQGKLKVYVLKQPDKVYRESLEVHPDRFADRSNPSSWELGEVVFEQNVLTDAQGKTSVPVKLAAGIYRILFEATDRFGKPVTVELQRKVLDPAADKLAIKIPSLVAAPKWSLEPGEEFLAVWGTGYDAARAYVEIEHRGKILQSFWTEPGTTQRTIRHKVDEAQRGGFTLRVTMVRENRAYIEEGAVDVPWSNKNLTIKWEHFVSKLEPGQKVTWTAVISGPDSTKAAAEMVATLYDASLDSFRPLSWSPTRGFFRKDESTMEVKFENEHMWLRSSQYGFPSHSQDTSLTYRIFPKDIVGLREWTQFSLGGVKNQRSIVGLMMGPVGAEAMDNRRRRKKANVQGEGADDDELASVGDAEKATKPRQGNIPDLSGIAARKDLRETAFFLPHLVSDKDGTVRIEFTMPDGLTEWKFIAFAHDRVLRNGFLTDTVVTSKELMVQPNPPRFVREGDLIEFTAKVSNQSAARQSGRVRLQFCDAVSLDSVDKQLGNLTTDQPFDIPTGQSQSFSWKLSVPDGLGFLTYKVVGASERLSDGEEGFLPVLPRRVLVTESLPLPLRRAGTKEFDFARLRESAQSDSLQHQSLTVQMASNPAWYAVMALPYLIEFPHECSEQTFNRMYANAVAMQISKSDPKLRGVFDAWKASGGDTLDSPLDKNQDLKSVRLEETPWVAQAALESQARRNVGILFDDSRLRKEATRHYLRLTELQFEDGRWPWFPGGPANDTITLYITAGYGKMRQLGIKFNVAPALKSAARMDALVTEMYQKIGLDRRDENNLSPTIAGYLYARSFFLKDLPIAATHQKAVDYWLDQAKKNWLELPGRQSQGHLAIALKRFDDQESARAIMASIKERSVNEEELGMFWRDQEQPWIWYRAPIETQATMIEAFDEVVGDQQAVEDCKVWLLKQKQTGDWKTTKATADAIYALLFHGSKLTDSDAQVEVTVGTRKFEPGNVEAGTGYYEQRFVGASITPELSEIKTKKIDEGVSWGSVHWQYLEDVSKVTSAAGTPLKLSKQLYTKQSSKSGPVLKQVNGPVAVGDELVVRITVTTDRDLEYVHLKDYRGSGTEPVNVLSSYRFQDGLHYYESTRDTASHFFIDSLPKGTYVFEYAVRVQLKGKYQTGYANIQSMYAPEFNSHSESISLSVE